MFRLLKYSKPYLLMILFSIGLLFAQANLELALPDYLSNIVDTGIQQGGVESSVPIVIREIEMDRLLLFTDTENASMILEKYKLIDENSSTYEDDLELYPILLSEPIYVLNKLKNPEVEELNQIMIKPLITAFIFEQAIANPENATEIFDKINYNPDDPPFGMGLFEYLEFAFPEEGRIALADALALSFEAIGETMLSQFAIVAVRAEYEIIGVNTDKIQNNFILRSGGLMLLMTLLAVICTIAVSYLASKTSAGMARDIRSNLFRKVENFSSIEFDSFSTASLITRSTNDVTQVQTAIYMIVRMVAYAPILGIGGIIRALQKSREMWWLIGVAVLALIIMISIVFTVSLPKFKIMQKLTDRINLVARENLTGMLVIRAFNMEEYEEKRFDKANIDLTAVSLFVIRVFVIMMPFMMLILNGLMIGIIWVGAQRVSELSMQVGDMMAFLQYAMQIVMAFLMLTMMFIVLPRAFVAGNRISEVLETDPVIKDHPEPKKFSKPFKGKVEFRNVSFNYPGAKKRVLENISFTAEPGQTTAFIGATGSGKSTVINLLPRFYEVTEGSILVDGVDIREVKQHDLREVVGFVPQKSFLFSGTIESNLRFAKEDASEEELQSSLEIAQATEFVTSKEEGIKSEIAQGGMNVSGGQKQRLSIARAMVKKPPIYIFDDSFSQLDFKTDAALRKALKKHTGDSTLLIVTQRVSTIKNAEQIIILDDGKIVGKGTHEELLKVSDIYREIATSQLELEEAS
ncbi:MAG: ABC transporter ATP-binding protein [Asgard group archaeon]|nr:ABC transporter ATP-binding protein [Asgard group archaeon]